ncbi:MAG: LytTR family DNA-binding domain-containing protein [Bacteroidota bacterium]
MGEELKVIIVDDDPSCHRTIKFLLEESHADVQILGNAYSVSEGVELIQNKSPNLIFLDIELSDGLGFDLLEQFHDPQFRVVFITAHNTYALTAIRFEALDFLEKPIDEEDIQVALDKARRSMNRIIDQEQLAYLLENYERAKSQRLPTRIVISSHSEINFLPVDQIVWLEAKETYTNFHMKGRKKPVLSAYNLGTYVKKFQPYNSFQQVHRSHMVNLDFVKKVNKAQRTVILEGGIEVGIARRFWDSFRSAMESF